MTPARRRAGFAYYHRKGYSLPLRQVPMSNTPKPVVEFHPDDRAVVAVIHRRDLDLVATQQIQQAIEAALQESPAKSLVIDLAAVQFVPSMALGVLVGLHKKMNQSGRKCLLCGCHPMVDEIIRATALHKILDIRPSVTDALQAL